MDLKTFLPIIKAYIDTIDLSVLPGWKKDRGYDVLLLAQGEYNMNFLLAQEENHWVVRVNVGSQIQREGQIRYEYDALKMLAGSGMTPKPFFPDDSKSVLDHGVLIMAYLPGEPFIYQRDFKEAARLFARIHSYSHQLPDGDI